MKLLNDYDSRIFAVVGLGNPGTRYARHRHNVGFMTVDALAEEHGGKWSPTKHDAVTCSVSYSDRALILIKPQTFMNLSGKAVHKILAVHRIDSNFLIVIHDDMDLHLGKVRIKQGGGDGGHRGVRSIADSLRFRDFMRVRLGVGRPPSDLDPEQYVLSPFLFSDASAVKRLINLGAEATKLIVSDGLERARNVIHAIKTEETMRLESE